MFCQVIVPNLLSNIGFLRVEIYPLSGTQTLLSIINQYTVTADIGRAYVQASISNSDEYGVSLLAMLCHSGSGREGLEGQIPPPSHPFHNYHNMWYQ